MLHIYNKNAAIWKPPNQVRSLLIQKKVLEK